MTDLKMTVVREDFIPASMFPTRREIYHVQLMYLMKGRKVFPWWRWRYVRCWLGAKGWMR